MIATMLAMATFLKPAFTVGEFKLIYEPAKPYCLNDHTFVKGPDRKWHMFGITHVLPLDFFKDPGRNLAHATADTLTQSPWKQEPFALTADPVRTHEYFYWAPHVVKAGSTYHMFVCVGAKDGEHVYRIHHLTSKDLWTWSRDPNNPVLEDGFDGRDPMVLRDGKRWILYYTCTSEPTGGRYLVAAVTSDDLVHWSKRTVVFTHTQSGTFGGPTESPFVVRRGKRYYLFITDGGVVNAYGSNDPLSWKMQDHVGKVQAHASEIVRDEKGRWFISHVGWMHGGLSLAPITWNDGLDKASASL